MKIRPLLLASALVFGFASSSNAQLGKSTCLTDKHFQQLSQKFPDVAKNREMQEQQIQQYISQQANQRKVAGVILKIPVVIHVVSEKGCNGISKAQILNGLEVLNKNFRRQNADTVNTRAIFKPVAADTEIEFVLARKDPNGNVTEGINRVTSATANAPYNRDDVKTAVPAWPTDKYFNIWLVDKIYDASVNSNILGYAQFPVANIWNTYGVVLLHNQWGKQAAVTGSTAISDGDNATHEISHCFNLQHDFGCSNSNGSCAGDLVADTPPFDPSLQTLPCDYNQNTCHNDVACSSYPTDVPDQIENFQSISDCQNMFTIGQKIRMQATLNSIPQLQNLISPVNAIVTGIDPSATTGAPLPEAYFCASNKQVCAGTAVNFTDLSYNGVATSWNWSFPGGTPATSTAQNPVITYTTPGQYTVTLTTANAAGSTSLAVTDFVTVTAVNNIVPINPPNYFIESFEDASFPNNPASNKVWRMQTSSLAANPVNWQRVTTAFSDGTAAMRLQNGAIAQGTISTLFTPNFSNSSSYLLFDVAYAKKTATPKEELRIYASTDCGLTWGNPFKVLTGNQLVTNGGGIVAGNFTPAATEWRIESVHLFIAVTSHVMFKIETTSQSGGNLYLDNFRLMNVLGTSEDIIDKHAVKVFPNPLTLETGIDFELRSAEKVSVKILDLVGKTVVENQATTFSAGIHTISLADKMQRLKAGMYLVQLNLGGKTANIKLLVE
jgi:PKD repeat protein